MDNSGWEPRTITWRIPGHGTASMSMGTGWITDEVTNEQFARFVKATGYVTVAERKPRAEDYPEALPEKLVAGSVVFSPPDHPVATQQSLPLVELCSRRELAPSGGS